MWGHKRLTYTYLFLKLTKMNKGVKEIQLYKNKENVNDKMVEVIPTAC